MAVANAVDTFGFGEIWAVDFEFQARPGELPDAICLVARELVSGRLIRLWMEELKRLCRPPYSIGANSLILAYYASAEMGCHVALGWPLPERLLDLYAEFRNLTNGRDTPCGAGVLGGTRLLRHR